MNQQTRSTMDEDLTLTNSLKSHHNVGRLTPPPFSSQIQLAAIPLHAVADFVCESFGKIESVQKFDEKRIHFSLPRSVSSCRPSCARIFVRALPQQGLKKVIDTTSITMSIVVVTSNTIPGNNAQ